MHVLALVKMNVPVHLYCQLQLEFDFHENTLAYESCCKDLQADVHTADENGFGVDVEDAIEKVDIDIGFENVRARIAGC